MELTYYITSALALYTAIEAVIMGTADRYRALYQAFAALCFSVALFLTATAWFYRAETLESFSIATKIQNIGAFGYLVAFAWMLALYAGVINKSLSKPLLITYSAVCTALLVYSLTLPYGFFLDNLQFYPEQEGSERFSFTYRKTSAAFQLLAILMVGWGCWCCMHMHRRGTRLAACLIGSYVLLQAVSATSQLLYYYDMSPFVLPGGVIFVWLFAVIGVCFGVDNRARVAELSDKSQRLSKELKEKAASEQRARQQAFTDELTRLANNRKLKAAIERCRKDKRRGYKLLVIQIDRYRELKQTFGETNCESLLRQLADRLRTHYRKAKLTARISEAEFALITTQPEEIIELSAESGIGQVIPGSALATPFRIGQQAIDLNYSIGMVDIVDSLSTEELLYHADLAIEDATNRGGDTAIYYDPSFAAVMAERQALELALDLAFKDNHFRLYYQPQLNANREPVGAEALIRWQHPVRGLISPALFIPLAERRGMMVELGDWVLEEACHALARWQRNGAFRGRLSINVSPWQLRAHQYADKTLATMRRFDISPDSITLELTESALIDDDKATYRELEKLRKAGVLIAIDDFGTGFSSLSYLARLPLDILKIDKYFIDQLHTVRGRQLLDGMLNIGAALDIKVVAEGVETPEQFQALVGMGCTHMQGFLFSKPLPEDEFLRWRPTEDDPRHSVHSHGV